ncbi:hypothetical protein SMSP2_01372 [Limihaloglobus sulfuriphilus]|uniref:LamG-like jellyroll fold domain-containing protein n=1 Tax=Limihaloglobus sulfuriphilus TaxID=1851148 RepID=A0A1Q2MEN8_9BACT|nr:LamG domain-containing protein [Limihaloglobus sulfuriphilus]AQQ71008.1 hypothetical protein SMSP2_01372 [Limihaloglobus sulfuriphilus]
MCKKNILLSAAVILILFCGLSTAANKVWWGYDDDNWDTDGNWAPEGAPTSADPVFIDQRAAGSYTYPVLTEANTDAKCAVLKLSQYGTGGRLDITGGKLSVSNLAYIGVKATYVTELNMSGGELIITNNMFVPYAGETTFTMTGGSVSIGGTLSVSHQAVADSFINLTGGTVEASAFLWNTGDTRFGHINIEEGTLQINSATDYTNDLQALIDSGDITAYGSGTTRYDWVSHPRSAFELEYTGSATILTAKLQDVNTAWSPSPSNRERVDNVNGGETVLSWSSGESTREVDGHDVYFGTSWQEVYDAQTESPEYIGRQSANDYNVGQLPLAETYYWRIDEIDPEGITYKGDVWQFSTQQGRVVCNFDDYTDTSGLLSNWTETGGAEVSLETAEIGVRLTTIENSMMFEYDNSAAPYYSEVSADAAGLPDFANAADWNWLEVEALYVSLHGVSDNDAADGLYVGLEDNTSAVEVVYYSDMNDLIQESWEDVIDWNIPLSEFAGVDLSNVQKVFFGLGSRTNPAAGSSGTVYIDSMTLYPPRCVGWINQGSDIGDKESSDCTGDGEDILALGQDWLQNYSGTITAASPAGSPVLYYDFEDGSGYYVTDRAGSHTGTISGDPLWNSQGYTGNCFEFDGITNYIDVDGAVIENLDSAVTVSSWIKASASEIFAAGGFLFSAKGDDGVVRFYLQMAGWPENQQQAIYTQFAVGNTGWPNTDNCTLGSIYQTPVGYFSQTAAKEWTHLAVTKNTADGTMKLYINGKLYAATNERTQAIGDDTAVFDQARLGASAANVALQKWRGYVDEFKIYDYELTQSEIMNLAGYAPGESLEQPNLSWADVNGDSNVNLADFAVLAADWLQTITWP